MHYKKMIFLICLCCTQQAFSQMAMDWGAFMQAIDAKSIAGKKFILEAAVKVEALDTTADAEIWVRVDRLNKKMGFFYNMMDKPIRSKEWKIYSISGKIDKDALAIVFGGLYHRKGNFYFDDFRLSVENSKGGYDSIPVKDPGFEADSTSFAWGLLQKRNGFEWSTVKNAPYKGAQSLLINGSSFEKTPVFGSNDSAGHVATVNNIKLYYEVYGEGEPILLLHGNSESIAGFNNQIPVLSKQFKVIAVDTRGQGKSTEDGRLYTYDLFAADMNAFLDYLKLDSVNILGWSDGGNTGLIMAMKYPKKVKRLVTMGANIFIDKTVVEKWVFKVLNKELKEIETDSIYNSKNRARLIQLLLTEPRHHFEELQSISCPVLVVAGEKDVIKPAHTQGIAQQIKNHVLWMVPHETHELPRENAPLFNARVLTFLTATNPLRD